MSTPMTSTQRLAVFRTWGVPIATPNGAWTSHNRAGHGAFADVNGVMIHHTGDDAADGVDFALLWNGRPDLPGPLCHWGMGDDGTAWMVGNGRANHAGIGSRAVLNAVIAENYVRYPPAPGPDNTDGNAHFYGQETMYSGGHAPDLRAYNSTVRLCAGICVHHGWKAQSVIGHKEWTSRKPDPGHVDMMELRKDIAAAIVMGAAKARLFSFGPMK